MDHILWQRHSGNPSAPSGGGARLSRAGGTRRGQPGVLVSRRRRYIRQRYGRIAARLADDDLRCKIRDLENLHGTVHRLTPLRGRGISRRPADAPPAPIRPSTHGVLPPVSQSLFGCLDHGTVSGSQPVPFSGMASSFAISSCESAKSKICAFCSIRSRLVDFVRGRTPL